jgi:ParB family chromosome partitioning protein
MPLDRKLMPRKVSPMSEFFKRDNLAEESQGASGSPVMLKVAQCVPFEGHPFRLYEGERLENMAKSIKKNGVMDAIAVRPKEGYIEVDGAMLPLFEILLGHNRVHGSKIAGLDEVPAFIKKGLSDEEAILFVTESNLNQRSATDMLPSEKARALKMRNDAYDIYKAKRKQLFSNDIQQASNPCDTEDYGQFPPLGEKRDSTEKSFEDFDPHSTTTERYISLLDLIDELLDMVDKGEIAVHAGAELSYLKQNEQHTVLECIVANSFKVDIVKAEALRAYSKVGTLTTERIRTVLSGVIKKPGRPAAAKVSPKVISKYFTQEQKQAEIDEIVEKALERWFAERGRT